MQKKKYPVERTVGDLFWRRMEMFVCSVAIWQYYEVAFKILIESVEKM